MTCYTGHVRGQLLWVVVLPTLGACAGKTTPGIRSQGMEPRLLSAPNKHVAPESGREVSASAVAELADKEDARVATIHLTRASSTPLVSESARLAPSVTGASGCPPLRSKPPAPGTFRFVTDPAPAKQRCPKGSVAIPGGVFRLDNRRSVIDSHGRVHPMPPTTENVETFCIGITEVTEQMLRESGLDDQAAASQWPAVVSYATAERYCEQQALRLPTRGEWLMTVYASSQSPFPWGYEFPMDGVCWLRAEGPPLCKVGTSPKDVTPEGVFDMVGNAREWTLAVRMQEYVDSVVLGAPSNDCIGTLLYGDLRKNSLGNTDVDVNGFRCVYAPDD